MSEHEHDVGKPQREVGEWIHPRHPAARMNEDRDLRGLRDPPDRLRPRVAEPERLGAWMQLDAPGAEREAALGLRHRILARIQATVGIHAAV